MFSTSVSFRYHFVYQSHSWRLYMLVHQGRNSFSKCSSRFFSEELKYSLSCIPECYSFYLIFWSWCYVIRDNFPSCFMIHRFSRVTYLNPSFSLCSRHLFNQLTSSLDLSWVIFHLKLSFKDCCFMVLIKDPSPSFILSVK